MTDIVQDSSRRVWAAGHSSPTPMRYVRGFFGPDLGVCLLGNYIYGGPYFWCVLVVLDEDGQWVQDDRTGISIDYVDEYKAVLTAAQEWSAEELRRVDRAEALDSKGDF